MLEPDPVQLQALDVSARFVQLQGGLRIRVGQVKDQFSSKPVLIILTYHDDRPVSAGPWEKPRHLLVRCDLLAVKVVVFSQVIPGHD